MGRDQSRLHRVLQTNGSDMGAVRVSRVLRPARHFSEKQESLQSHPVGFPQPLEVSHPVLINFPHFHRSLDDAELEGRRRRRHLQRSNRVSVSESGDVRKSAEIYRLGDLFIDSLSDPRRLPAALPHAEGTSLVRRALPLLVHVGDFRSASTPLGDSEPGDR